MTISLLITRNSGSID